MGFDKHYPNRKDHRAQYPGNSSKRFDASCRPHGGCPWCEGNRMRQTRSADEDERLGLTGHEPDLHWEEAELIHCDCPECSEKRAARMNEAPEPPPLRVTLREALR